VVGELLSVAMRGGGEKGVLGPDFTKKQKKWVKTTSTILVMEWAKFASQRIHSSHSTAQHVGI